MSLDDAITAHADWKMKLWRAIREKAQLDVAAISSDNKCPLGEWLHGDARGKYARLTSYDMCVAKHAEFHKCAGEVAMKINAGNYAEAEAMLASGTPYAAVSSAVGVAIVLLRRQARI